MSPAMCRRQPFLTSMFVPLLQITQLSESQRVAFRSFSAQSLDVVRVNPNTGAQSTSFPNTVVRGVQPTLSAVGTVPGRHSVQLSPDFENVLPVHGSHPVRAWFGSRPFPHDTHCSPLELIVFASHRVHVSE